MPAATKISLVHDSSWRLTLSRALRRGRFLIYRPRGEIDVWPQCEPTIDPWHGNKLTFNLSIQVTSPLLRWLMAVPSVLILKRHEAFRTPWRLRATGSV